MSEIITRRHFLGRAAAIVPVAAAASIPAIVNASANLAFASATIPAEHLILGYSSWLFYERRFLCMEMYPDFPDPEQFIPQNTGADGFHFPRRGSHLDVPAPSSRAAMVLSSVGIDLVDVQRRYLRHPMRPAAVG